DSKGTCQDQELARVLRQAARAIRESRPENGRARRYQERGGPGNITLVPLRPVRSVNLWAKGARPRVRAGCTRNFEPRVVYALYRDTLPGLKPRSLSG